MSTKLGREVQIPIANLHPNPKNPRREAGDISDLSASMKKVGQLQPLIVSPSPAFGMGHYLIEDGYRRWTSAKHAGLTQLSCKVRDAGAGEGGAPKLVVAIVANLHENLSAMEKAEAYKSLRDEYGYTQTEIANLTGLNIASIGRY